MTAYLVLILRVLLAAGLYIFLGYVMYTIWQELRVHSDFLQQRKIPNLTLTQRDLEPAATYNFDMPEVTIGRDPNCHLAIAHEMVSARHARLIYHHNQWWVEDLHSTNGTYINDERVETPTVLSTGDELSFGMVKLEVTIHH